MVIPSLEELKERFEENPAVTYLGYVYGGGECNRAQDCNGNVDNCISKDLSLLVKKIKDHLYMIDKSL